MSHDAAIINISKGHELYYHHLRIELLELGKAKLPFFSLIYIINIIRIVTMTTSNEMQVVKKERQTYYL
jgi:hypothetical protein